MILTRKLVLVLCLVLLSTNWQDSKAQQLQPGQVYTTPDVVINTPQGGPSSWTNGVYQSSLTCWGPGGPGYCGPNAIVRPGNNINFSYGQTDLYQAQAIANLLPQTSGLFVNGYTFRFTAKNGNGWDDGRVDQLSAYVRFTDQKGAVVQNDIYNLTYKFNWTTFNFNKDFTSPYDAKTLNTVQYGFIGRDNNFWAGPYGPEVNSVSFQLKYSVDPCVTNPLYSTSCSGYLAALNSLVPQQPTTTTNAALAPTTVLEPAATTATPQPQLTTNTVAPTSTVLAPVSSPQQTQQSTGSNTQLALSVIARNQDRERQNQANAVQLALDVAQQAVDKTLQTAQQVAQAAQQTSQQESTTVVSIVSTTRQQIGFVLQPQQLQQVQEQQFRQNASVVLEQQVPNTTTSVNATQTVQQTLVGNVPSVTTTLLQAPTTQFVTAIKPQQQEPQATITVPQQQQVFQTQQTAQVATTPAPQQNLIEVANTQQALLDQGQQAAQQLNRQYKEPEPLPQTSTNLVDRSNPLNDFLTNNQLQTTSSQQSNPQEVRREQQQNELANGISIDKIATTPQGYTQYLNLVLVDSRFYAARDIYTRQTNVDNQRLLRQLSSDKLHQQMVNQQYK